ncbi:hypothetical protein GPROT2_00160 [Gammaproteobacteria bacterium]|nr:hypothetical protein GPROT2_00160 [Gammaproteobacteria bacterium]
MEVAGVGPMAWGGLTGKPCRAAVEAWQRASPQKKPKAPLVPSEPRSLSMSLYRPQAVRSA